MSDDETPEWAKEGGEVYEIAMSGNRWESWTLCVPLYISLEHFRLHRLHREMCEELLLRVVCWGSDEEVFRRALFETFFESNDE